MTERELKKLAVTMDAIIVSLMPIYDEAREKMSEQEEEKMEALLRIWEKNRQRL